MTAPHRPIADLEEERLKRHAYLEDDARWAFVVEDRPAEAARLCREAIRLWDGCYDVWTLYGAIYRELDRPAIALQAFRSAARVDDTQAEAYWEIGEVYEACRRPRRALTEYRRAKERLRRGERDLRAWIVTGEVRCLLALGRYEEALGTARAALKSLRGEPELRRLRDLALRRRHLRPVYPPRNR
jgi:tetratricopeptide (TPR) repeat protein